ncbi:transcriptional repressor [Phenylobacterium sp.]|uniref:transcriptional repressor n=1 Tax=Phenylobacterium sp. TaxID=1871053 RepID=UPI002C336FC6|nr:transcriptional repressor [Phenylobacterium sp.]HLZ74087.1 transcriptional repressor [Phenylobacterium sp.]
MALREELQRAGLPAPRALVRLLALLRDSPETHLRLADVMRLAAQNELPTGQLGLARQLESLADHGLLGRLPTTEAEAVFDTVPEAHAHLIYEEDAQVVDLHVSPETLLAILRHALAAWPGEVAVLARLPARAAGSDASVDRTAADGGFHRPSGQGFPR